MESFSAEWLALREPADHAARANGVTAEVAARVDQDGRTRAIDLAAGAGSNVRYLLPRLPRLTHWTLVDYDSALLDVARRTLEPLAREHGVGIETRQMNLVDLDELPLDGCALVTAAALLDLVSDRWLRAFAERCREARTAVLCALSYDGRISCEPRDADDEWIRTLVNTHQQTDKGLGPALGPAAVRQARIAFADWDTRVLPSDWQLGPESAALQRQLVTGWAAAARELSPSASVDIDGWQDRRLADIDAGQSRIIVGHLDLAVFPQPAASTRR